MNQQTNLKISPEEFKSWLNNPITKEVFSKFKAQVELYNQFFINSDFLKTKTDKELLHLAGVRDGLQVILSIDVQDMEESNDETLQTSGG